MATVDKFVANFFQLFDNACLKRRSLIKMERKRKKEIEEENALIDRIANVMIGKMRQHFYCAMIIFLRESYHVRV